MKRTQRVKTTKSLRRLDDAYTQKVNASRTQAMIKLLSKKGTKNMRQVQRMAKNFNKFRGA